MFSHSNQRREFVKICGILSNSSGFSFSVQRHNNVMNQTYSTSFAPRVKIHCFPVDNHLKGPAMLGFCHFVISLGKLSEKFCTVASQVSNMFMRISTLTLDWMWPPPQLIVYRVFPPAASLVWVLDTWSWIFTSRLQFSCFGDETKLYSNF